MATLATLDRPMAPAPRAGRAHSGRWRRFVANRLSLVGAIILVFLVMAALAGPVIASRAFGLNPNTLSCESLADPSRQHPFGCDPLGRDILVRLLAGGRVSLAVGLLVAVCTTVLGLLVGLTGGYLGGIVDSLLMRFTDTMLAMPTFFLVLATAAFIGPSLLNTILIIGLTQWMVTARLIRSECLSLREQEFILAARVTGLSNVGVMRHILLNVLSTVIVVGTLAVATGILTESALSYLGLGIQPPNASWGSMLGNAQGYIFVKPLQGIYPGILIVMTVLAVNFVGEGLREAFDPRLTRR
ncbi:MAG: ABC transporter, permease protein 2 (cluster 5, nickel/peptides/opines) [uncultured Thermomicrobiales bacterium]|uniref:ABC transporter, permease protein 2 (Cluster 5, nickel/peptides/opines) n=1 Tax=uncultured Thermomicrobiales bacterium TaxID=1645740 RepID=A0A6J4V679_9BACT|nr:MAG: ABC transporter, permease protein 2 (cluster 5, nickel/peptides/opines) [uncultured Thermomicrobiales bacterium]